MSKYQDFDPVSVPTKFVNFIKLVPTFPSEQIYPLSEKCKIVLSPMEVNENCIERVTIEQAGKRTLCPARIDKNFAKIIAKSIINRVQAACKAKANIICFTEYCYPEIEHNYLKEQLSRLSKENQIYIVAGSFAQTISPVYNTSYIFTPFVDEPFKQYKFNHGKIKGKEEEIELPDPKITHIFRTSFGSFAVAICADISDKNLKHNVEVYSRRVAEYQPIDLILVPAYTGSPDEYINVCCSLSYTSKNCIIYLNDTSYGDHSEIFVNGEQQEKNTFSPIKIKGEKPMHLFTLDVTLIKNAQIRAYGNKAILPAG